MKHQFLIKHVGLLKRSLMLENGWRATELFTLRGAQYQANVRVIPTTIPKGSLDNPHTRKRLYAASVDHIWNEKNIRRFSQQCAPTVKRLNEICLQLHIRGLNTYPCLDYFL